LVNYYFHDGFTIAAGQDGIAWKRAALIAADRLGAALGCYLNGIEGLTTNVTDSRIPRGIT
jgi:hypothetical protein